MHFKCSIVVFLLVVSTYAVSAQLPCLTPYNTYGRCVPANQCEFLQRLFAEYGLSLPEQHRNEVLKARCAGPDRNQIYLCCGNSARMLLNERGLSILRAQDCGNDNGDKLAGEDTGISFIFGSGGKNADLFEFPWMAQLRYDHATEPYRCGGSLITNRHVLTAAHCVVNERILEVRLGEYNTATDPDCVVLKAKENRKICAEPVEDYGIESIISHPEFSVAYKSNDVALIKLDRVVQFKDHIRPICLPITESAAQLPNRGQFYVAGWGLTETGKKPDIVQEVPLPFVSQSECRSFFTLTPLTNNHICAGGVGIMDACSGDSGGPLFYFAPYNNNQRYVQYGVVSFGKEECGTGQSRPGIYANVINYMPWITANLV